MRTRRTHSKTQRLYQLSSIDLHSFDFGWLGVHLRRHGWGHSSGWALFAAASVMFLVGTFICYGFEQSGNPNLTKLGIESQAS